MRTGQRFELSKDFRACGVIRTAFANKKQYFIQWSFCIEYEDLAMSTLPLPTDISERLRSLKYRVEILT